MKTLVSGDELVGEGEAWHQAALLEPEDGRKRAGEEDPLDDGEGDNSDAKGKVPVDPLEGPGGLLLDAGHRLDGAEEVVAFLGLLDVCVNEEGVHLRVNVLNGNLEAVETPSSNEQEEEEEEIELGNNGGWRVGFPF